MKTPRIGWAKDWDLMQQEDEKPPAALDYIRSDTLSTHERLVAASNMISDIVREYDRQCSQRALANNSELLEHILAGIDERERKAKIKEENEAEREARREAKKKRDSEAAKQQRAYARQRREHYESTPDFKSMQAKMHDEKLQSERAEEAKKKALYARAIEREAAERNRWYINERARMAQVSAEIRRAEWDEYVEKRRQLYMGVIWPELPVAELNRAAKRMGLELH